MSAAPTMRDLRQWVCWCSEERNNKKTKVPYSPSTGTRARSDEPSTWSTLAEARRTAEREDYDGIGFVFTADDPFCGVDLDGCVDRQTGEIQPWAADILDDLNSYTEFSPSSEGLHIIVRAELPKGRRRGGGVEMYDRGRFFTVTGRHLSGTPKQVENRQREISALHTRIFPPLEESAPPTDHTEISTHTSSDEEILRRARSAANGDKFATLWSGDRTGYASDSEADLALCSMLAFWTGPDEERIASLFARSGLMRDKWNRPDYRRRTIAQALEGAEFHNPSKNGAVPPRNGHSGASEIAFLANPGLPPTLPEAPRFPVDAMPTACRTLIEESEKALGCAPELVAFPMLAVLSSAIGTTRVVEIKGGWREWSALFLAVVASPGAMKTPAAKVAKPRPRRDPLPPPHGPGPQTALRRQAPHRPRRRWRARSYHHAPRRRLTTKSSKGPGHNDPAPRTRQRGGLEDGRDHRTTTRPDRGGDSVPRRRAPPRAPAPKLRHRRGPRLSQSPESHTARHGGPGVPSARGRLPATGAAPLHPARRLRLRTRPLLVLPIPRGRQASQALPRQDQLPRGYSNRQTSAAFEKLPQRSWSLTLFL